MFVIEQYAQVKYERPIEKKNRDRSEFLFVLGCVTVRPHSKIMCSCTRTFVASAPISMCNLVSMQTQMC